MENSKQPWSRRMFINTLSGTGALVMLSPLLGSCTIETLAPRLVKLVAQTMDIDTFNRACPLSEKLRVGLSVVSFAPLSLHKRMSLPSLTQHCKTR